MYHREDAQEGFLVVAGECLLIVEGRQRRLKTWDYFHSPPGTEHVIVGSGQSPAVVVAVGARGRGGVVYPESKVAARFGASVEHETRNATEAYAEVYADLPRSHWVKYRKGWLPEDANPRRRR
jgi:uncharacterized cupin superfamily protein